MEHNRIELTKIMLILSQFYPTLPFFPLNPNGPIRESGHLLPGLYYSTSPIRDKKGYPMSKHIADLATLRISSITTIILP